MSKRFFRPNLQIKVMLLFVAVALVPLGIMGALALKTAEDLIVSMVQNQIQHVAQDKAALLERWISERKADLEVVAASSILRSLDPAQVAPYLDLVRDKYTVYNGFIVVSRDRGVIYDTLPPASQSDITRWLQQPLCGPSAISDIGFYPQQQKSFFLVAAPLYGASDTVAGTVCAKVGADAILSMVLRLSLGETGECYLVNQEGIFLAHKEPERILTENIAQSDSFKNIFQAGPPGMTYIDYRGIEVLGASAKVAGTNWAIVVEQDKEEAFRGAVRLKRSIYLVAVVTAGGALFLAWLLSYYLVKPIQKLSLAANCLAQGEFDRADFTLSRRDEIGLLANALRDMAQQLRDRQQALERRMVRTASKLEETGEKLKETQQAVVRSQQLASLGQLASGVAHEIRTPLTSLKLFLEAVESEIAITPEYEADLQMAMGQIKRMEATINRFLDFARPQDPVYTRIDVGDLLAEALLVIGPQARLQETAIEKHLPSSLPPITGDRQQLGEALINLMVNALEALSQGGRLTVTAALVEASYQNRRGRAVRLDIADSGPGIEAANLPRLFEPFFTTKATGAGLGLSIVSTTVRRHGGDVLVQSSPEAGTVFSLLLPVDTEPMIGEDGKNSPG